VSLPYQIVGVRGEAKKINIRREFVGWTTLALRGCKTHGRVLKVV
jgi:hypothetical protein